MTLGLRPPRLARMKPDAPPPVRRRHTGRNLAIIVAALAVAGAAISSFIGPSTAPVPQRERGPLPTELSETVASLRSEGLIRELKVHESGCDLTVAPAFFNLERDDRVRVLSVVGLVSLHNGDTDYVRIFDPYTGGKIGFYLRGQLHGPASEMRP